MKNASSIDENTTDFSLETYPEYPDLRELLASHRILWDDFPPYASRVDCSLCTARAPCRANWRSSRVIRQSLSTKIRKDAIEVIERKISVKWPSDARKRNLTSVDWSSCIHCEPLILKNDILIYRKSMHIKICAVFIDYTYVSMSYLTYCERKYSILVRSLNRLFSSS